MDKSELNMLVAKRLRAAVDDAGLRVEDVAKRAGYAPSSIYRKLRGERHITATELCRVAAVLRRHPATFLRPAHA